MLSLLLALCLATPVAPPSRVLLIADPAGQGYEQTLLFRALMLRIEASPDQILLTDARSTFSLRAGARLAQRSHALCDRAQQALQDLDPEQARDLAEQAVSLAERTATNTGSMTSLARALLLGAVAYDALGYEATADALLRRVACLGSQVHLDRTLVSPRLQGIVYAARHADRTERGRAVTLFAHPSNAALFWDGAFVGFGTAEVFSKKCYAHQAVALAPGYSARIQAFDPQKTPDTATLTLLPDPGHHPSTEAQDLVSKSRIPGAFVDPQGSLLETWAVNAVWVLRYDMGHVHLTQFDLRRGKRSTLSAACAIASLSDAEDLANDLANKFELGLAAGAGPTA